MSIYNHRRRETQALQCEIVNKTGKQVDMDSGILCSVIIEYNAEPLDS